MEFVRHYRSLLLFAGLLALCSVLVIHQITLNQSKHVELREAFILLQTRGYQPEAQRLYLRLLKELEQLPAKAVLEDFQRTLTLVDPQADQTNNLIWDYHWTVSHELEKRSEASLQRALKLANRP